MLLNLPKSLSNPSELVCPLPFQEKLNFTLWSLKRSCLMWFYAAGAQIIQSCMGNWKYCRTHFIEGKKGVRKDFSIILHIKEQCFAFERLSPTKKSPDRVLDNNRELSCSRSSSSGHAYAPCWEGDLEKSPFHLNSQAPCKSNSKFHSGTCQLTDHRKWSFLLLLSIYLRWKISIFHIVVQW